MAYFAELRAQWRPLTAALIGLASGMSIHGYITSIQAPHLLAEFGWTRSEFAYVGSLQIFMVVALPIIGRLTDVIGVKRTALIGVVILPVTWLLLSMIKGDIRVYAAIFLVQGSLGLTTTATVYSRIVVEYVERARGLALAIAVSGPAIAGLIFSPILNDFVIDHGWRAGYQALAAFSLGIGSLALLMMPPERKEGLPARPKRRAREDYPLIFRHPAFWVLLGSMLLCNLPQTIVLTQINLLMIDNGVSVQGAGLIVSAFAVGMLVGRFLCGLAIDHWPPHLVSAFSMVLPAVGLFTIASDFDAYIVLMLAVLLVGIAYGAEGDLLGYLVARVFGVGIYSSVMGLMTMATSTATSAGAALLGLTLQLTGGYVLFLSITGTTVLVGGLLFLLLPWATKAAERPVMAGAE